MTKSKILLQAGVLAAVVFGSNVRAFAQPETAAPPPQSGAAVVASGGGAGNGLGVGAEAWLSGLSGATVTYDQYVWHIEGVLGFDSHSNGGNNAPRTTGVEVGVSGWYHLAHGASSDFSLGGGVGFLDSSTGGASAQAVAIEPGAMVRVFLTPNVSLSGRVGLRMVFGDDIPGVTNADSVSLLGQTTAGLGFTYFFR
jgi:hypothetical protein